MAKKRKTLPEHLQEIIDCRDMEQFRAVFDRCEISATNRGKTTQNIFSYRNLTLEQVSYLVEQGIDLNADSGWGNPPAAFLANDLELLNYLIANGADIEYAVNEHSGNALFINAGMHRVQAVENLLLCGANPEPRGGWSNNTALDEALQRCSNIDLVNMVKIAAALLAAGAKPTEKTVGYVKRIGENFEFMRPDFNSDYVDESSQALDALYALFHVEVVPRRIIYDSKTPISVNGETWQKQYDELWKLLVPGSGHATTVPGEVIRIVGKIAHELLDNGGINWDADYRKMAASLSTYFQTFAGDTTEKACALAARITSNSDQQLLYAITELAVRWVLEHNEPVPLETVDYRR